jgi:hypothetical protein
MIYIHSFSSLPVETNILSIGDPMKIGGELHIMLTTVSLKLCSPKTCLFPLCEHTIPFVVNKCKSRLRVLPMTQSVCSKILCHNIPYLWSRNVKFVLSRKVFSIFFFAKRWLESDIQNLKDSSAILTFILDTESCVSGKSAIFELDWNKA